MNLRHVSSGPQTHLHGRRRRTRVSILILASCWVTGVLASGPAPAADAPSGRSSHASPEVTLLDTVEVPAMTSQLGVPFGGLSGIDYDPSDGSYVALSDDRSEHAPARFYRLELPVEGQQFAPSAPSFTSVVTLRDDNGQPFARRAVDPESLRLSPSGDELVWASEGAASSGQPAFVREAALDGGFAGEATLPAAFAPGFEGTTQVRGVRNNQAIESLTFSREGTELVAAVENALIQDGPTAGLNVESPSRVAVLDRASGRTTAEHVYSVDPVEQAPTAPLPAPINTYAADRGLSEMLALNETDYLAVERSFASGVGYSVKVYWTTTLGATDVRGREALRGDEQPMPKRLLFDFAKTGTEPDNVEGITWGPRLDDGARSLVLVADDNFGFVGSVTKFHLLRVPVDLLAVRTADIDRDGRVNGRDLSRLSRAGEKGDLNGDGLTDRLDTRLWQDYTDRFHRPPSRPSTVDLQLLSFNDFHGHLEPPPGRDAKLGTTLDPSGTTVGGAEYLASALKTLRRGAGPSVTVAAGDLIGASPLISGLFHDEPAIESLESLGLDVSSVGNHEFDEGVDELLRIQRGGCHPIDGCSIPHQPYDGADFPFLAANVVDKEHRQPILAPTAVTRVGGIKVGFIGMTLEGTPSVTGASGVASVDFLDEVETANRSAAELTSRGVRAIIVLLHEGGVQSGSYGQCHGISGPIVQIAQGLSPAIDTVVTGHTHQPYVCSIPDPRGEPRLVTSASSFGRVVTEARIPISTATRDVVRSDVEARNHLVAHTLGKDADQTAIVDKWRQLSAPRANRVVGRITDDIIRSQTRDAESNLANLIADAQLAATAPADRGGAQIAFMNPGGVRADLIHATSTAGEAPGEITYAEAYAVQPFAGSLVSVDLTGAQIEEILEQQFNNSGSRAPTLMLGVSEGFAYAYSASRPVGDRIDPSSITLDAAVIDPGATYRVTANTFLADGGDGFTTFAQGQRPLGGGDDIIALTDYLGDRSPVSPPGTDRVTELP